MAFQIIHPVLRPILFHRRSWMIFGWHLIASAAASGVLWVTLDPLVSSLPHTSFLFHPAIRVFVVLSFSVFATAVTSIRLIAPIRRIEEWFEAREKGGTVRTLKVRAGDPFETLIRLVNELHQRAKAPAPVRRRARAPVSTPRPRSKARAS